MLDAAAGGIGRVVFRVCCLVERPLARVERGAQEAGDRQTGDGCRVLEGEEDAQPAALIGRELQKVVALPDDFALRDRVGGVAHQRISERRLARAVATHDRVDFALANREVDAAQDLARRVGDRDHVKVTDDQLAVVRFLT